MIKKILTLFTVVTVMFFESMAVMAQEKDNSGLTPIEIDYLLKDVSPIKISNGVYLREKGELCIYDIDASINITQNNSADIASAKMISNVSLRSWDLNTSAYSASFQAAYRVLSRESFSGYTDLYVQYSNVNCRSGSQWKSALYDGWTEISASNWLSSSNTGCITHFYNLNTSTSYNVAFVKTDNGAIATGNVKVFLQ